MLRLVLFLLAFFITSGAQGALLNSSLEKQIKVLLKSEDEDINAGIYIKDLSAGSVFSYHGKRMFSPASIVKLFTTYGALTYLGPDYKFKTSIASNQSKIHGTQLNDDVYIQFSGDPSFTYSDLKTMLGKLGVSVLNGNIVLDGTMFDENQHAPGGFTWDDHPFYYASPKSSIVVNKNCSEAKMMPSSEAGHKAKLVIEDPKILNIENNVLTVAPRKQECPYKSRYIGHNQYEVYGCMFQNMKTPVRLNFALQDNHLMIQSYIKKAFEELNIKFAGQIKFGKASFSKQNIIFVHESAPLKVLFMEILAHSCNTHASSLFKHTAAKYVGDVASDEIGEEVLKKLLRKSGLKGKFVIKDGSGESRYNLIAPETVVSLLELIYQDQNIRDLFIETLPRYGTNGTLTTRSVGVEYDKYIYAKTGYDSRVSALAGYYLPKDGHVYAFAVMINNHAMSWEQVKSLEDKVLHEILSVVAKQE